MISGKLTTRLKSYKTLHHGIRTLADWLLPQHCALCNIQTADNARLCPGCTVQLWAPLQHACRICALPLHADGVCGACLKRKPLFSATLAAALYTAPFDQLLIGLKFRAQLAHAPLFADLLAARIARNGWPGSTREHQTAAPQLLLPVPLYRQRLAERGFNQSAEIARLLGQRTNVPVRSDVLLRIRPTPPQASLALKARRANLRRAFSVPDRALPLVQGKRVALLDDVMTSGATLNELARTLRRAGAVDVVNLVVARTP